jgi:hypothetical protein
MRLIDTIDAILYSCLAACGQLFYWRAFAQAYPEFLINNLGHTK